MRQRGVWGANEDSSQRIGEEPGRAGPPPIGHLPLPLPGRAEGEGSGRTERGQRGGREEAATGRPRPGGTKRGEEEGRKPGGKTGEWLPRRPRPPELLLRLCANGVPRGERPFGEHKARLRPLPPIPSSTTALSGVRSVGSGNECESTGKKVCATIKTTDLPARLPASCHDLKISCRDKLEIKEER